MTRPLATSSQRAEASRMLSEWRAVDPGHRKLKREPLSTGDITTVYTMQLNKRCSCGAAYVSKLKMLEEFLNPEAVRQAIKGIQWHADHAEHCPKEGTPC